MTAEQARQAAKQMIAQNGHAFLLHWPTKDFWTVIESRPSFRAPGMTTIEISGDGKEKTL